ncbi:phage tail tube protein [Jiella pelagia]|uniref:Phage tail tube protein n=1 Tax=Jiella pelagia TaxID=2986949 RepID=A0ABY7BVY9_9HYPH|nr:phage tail tube protein [Jiella pelagia]WAP67230.1 phage tail tube protein [Jiella pelagia]
MPTLARTASFGAIQVLLGDGADPETFSAPCGFTSKSHTQTQAMNETAVPYCDDPDKPSEIERDVVSRSSAISGSGVMDQVSVATWQAWYDSGLQKNVKVIKPAGSSTITTTQPYHLSSFEVTVEKGGKAAVSVQMESTGAPVTVTA